MSFLAARGFAINLSHVKSLTHERTIFRDKRYVKVTWGGVATEGSIFFHAPANMSVNIYEEEDKELYDKLIKIIYPEVNKLNKESDSDAKE